MDDGAGGKDLGVEELDGAGTGGAELGLSASLDDGGGADPVLVEQAGRGEGVGQLAGAKVRMSPPSACFSRLTSSSRCARS